MNPGFVMQVQLLQSSPSLPQIATPAKFSLSPKSWMTPQSLAGVLQQTGSWPASSWAPQVRRIVSELSFRNFRITDSSWNCPPSQCSLDCHFDSSQIPDHFECTCAVRSYSDPGPFRSHQIFLRKSWATHGSDHTQPL
jgi:hypothetical protein